MPSKGILFSLLQDYLIQKKSLNLRLFRGAYGTRTRDPMRDRHVF